MWFEKKYIYRRRVCINLLSTTMWLIIVWSKEKKEKKKIGYIIVRGKIK